MLLLRPEPVYDHRDVVLAGLLEVELPVLQAPVVDDPRVVPPLKVKIERADEFPEAKLDELASEMAEAFRAKAKCNPEIIWVEPGELERSTYKGQVFEKLFEE